MHMTCAVVMKTEYIHLCSKRLSLSFRLEIPQVRGQPHGFSVSTQLYSPRPSGRAASPPCYTSRCRSTFFSVYPYSVVHVHLHPRFSWHNPPLFDVVHAQTISTWPPVPCPWYMLLRGCDECGVASAGLNASLHLIPDNHTNITPLSFFTGRMPFLPPS